MRGEEDFDPWEILACMTTSCRVNTFDRGNDGRCPACNGMGEEPTQW